MPGTYDPITQGHLLVAQAGLAEGDLVVLLPTAETFHKNPMPFDIRLHLVDRVTADQARLAVPSQGAWKELAKSSNSFSTRFYQHIREVNPQAKISLLIGNDVAQKTFSYVIMAVNPDEVLVTFRSDDPDSKDRSSPFLKFKNVKFLKQVGHGYSSTKVRTLLSSHTDLYFAEPEARLLDPNFQAVAGMVSPALAHEILDQGLYINKTANNSVAPLQLVHRWFKPKLTNLFMKMGIYERFKAAMVALVRYPDRKFIKINGQEYPLKKYLGSGLSADAYLMDYEGVTVAIKIPRTAAGRDSILRTIPVHLFAQQRVGITSPEIIAYDPEGAWIMSEFIEGKSLPKYIAENGGLPESIKADLRTMQNKVLQFSDKANVTLDFAPDNLIIRDGQVYLVDMGEVPSNHVINVRGPSLVERWISLYTSSPVSMNRCEAVFR